MDKERKEARKGWLFGLSGLALLIKLILSSFDITIPEEALDQIVNLVLGVMAAFGAYRNNYLGDLGRAQFRLLKHSDMQHFFDQFGKNDK